MSVTPRTLTRPLARTAARTAAVGVATAALALSLAGGATSAHRPGPATAVSPAGDTAPLASRVGGTGYCC